MTGGGSWLSASWLLASVAAAAVVMIGMIVRPRHVRRPLSPRSDVGNPRAADRGRADRLRAVARWSLRRFRRDRPAAPGDVASWIDDVSRAVGHGRSLHSALLDARPAAPRVEALTEPLRLALSRGTTVRQACHDWSVECERVDTREGRRLAMTGSVVGVIAGVGGSVGQPLDRLAAALRRAAADDADRAAHAAQARLSVRVLTVVPLVVLALLVAVDGDVRAALATQLGLALVGGGLVLNACGAWWMRRIIAGDTS